MGLPEPSPPHQIRGCDFPSTCLCVRLLQTCLSVTWQYLYLLRSHFSFSREFLKLPHAIGNQSSVPAVPPRECVTLRRVLMHGFASSSRFPFPQTYTSVLILCSWLLSLGHLSSAAVYKQHPGTGHLSAMSGLDGKNAPPGLVLEKKKTIYGCNSFELNLGATGYVISIFLQSHTAVLYRTGQKRAGDSRQIPETNDNHKKNHTWV